MSTSVDKNTETKGLRKKFLKYLLPSVASMWVYSLYTIVDGIFVSRGVGPTALASVNIAMPFVNFIFSVSMLFTTGASTMIAIHLGRNDSKKANEIFSMNVTLLVIVSMAILITSLLNLDKLALFLGASKTTIEFVKTYLKIIIIFNMFFIVSYSLEVIIKTDGFPQYAIVGVVISALTNIVLDWLFVIEFKWGIEGAAVATGISQLFSCIFFLVHFLKRKGSRLNFVKFKFDFSIIRKILFIGVPDGITELSSGVVIFLFNQSILRYIGENGVVTYSIISYVNTLIIMTMIGITQGMQPLTSFYYGKGENSTVKKLLKMSFRVIGYCSIIVFVISMFFTRPIVRVFIDGNVQGDIFNYSVKAFRIFSISFLILGYNILISGFFASVAKPIHATIISLGRGLIIIIASLFVMVALFGGNGIWMATSVSEGICLILSSFILKKSNLKRYKADNKKIEENKSKIKEEDDDEQEVIDA
ncbi:MATE family efflux transporter [Clostridiaceae bacterium 14S0207]|nr:MATE family efflux transporter [Clostridiaceae bacterium 14S0207]